MPDQDPPREDGELRSEKTQPIGSLPTQHLSDIERTNPDELIRKTMSALPSSVKVPVSTTLSRHALDLSDVARDFEIGDGFAEGGQGKIATAKDRTLHRMVAIKSLKSEHLTNEAQVTGFLSEAGVTAQLDHPSIVPLYALCSDSEAGLHIAMKMINGKTLQAYTNEIRRLYQTSGIEAYDERNALYSRLEYFLKVCEAIAYAHNRGILHRDLKPENIMIGEFGEVYVMDWGIAIRTDELDGTPPEKIRQGTPGFIAPEVIANRGVSPQSDIFSLGAILFEIVTLQPALKGATVEDILRKTVSGDVSSLEHFIPSVRIPPDVKAIVRKAMHMNPKERYASVDALREDVHRFMVGEEVKARPDNALRAVGRRLVLHKELSLALFFGILLLCAGFSIFVLINKVRAEHTARNRQFVLANLQNDVTVQAHAVDSHIMNLEATLTRYAQRAAFMLGADSVEAAGSSHPFHAYAELEDLDTAPGGTIASPLYGENVSFDFSTYKLAPGPPPGNLDAILSRVALLDRGLFQSLVESDPALRYDPARDGEFRATAATVGFPLRFIYIGMSNGLILCYPGKSRFDASYDPRKRDWYRQAAVQPGVVWIKPYYDAFGQGLIFSAALSVRDADGGLLGVASVDITLEHIVDQLMGERERSQFVTSRRYLLDGDGMIIVDSSLENMADEEREADFGALQLRKYEREAFVPFLKQRRGGQVEFMGKDGPVILACAPIPRVGWYFVEELPVGNLDFSEIANQWKSGDGM